MNRVAEAKARLPLPELMSRCGLGDRARKSARCPFHDDLHNSFSVWENRDGWRFKCHAGCGAGDEINFLELQESLSRKDATTRFLEMAGVNGAKPRSTSTLDWPKCADAFADRHIKGLARWRGYCDEFVNWLKENRLILIAEQVDKVNPDLVVRGEDGKVTTVRYEAVNAMLLNEFLKEHRRVEEQGVTVAQQKKDFASQLARQQKAFEAKFAQQQQQVEALTATVQKVSNQLELNKAAQQVVANNQ